MQRAIARMPRSVYRIRGFLRDLRDPDHRHLVQAVGMRAEVGRHDAWGERRPATELVIVADRTPVDRDEVEAIPEASRR